MHIAYFADQKPVTSVPDKTLNIVLQLAAQATFIRSTGQNAPNNRNL